MEQSNAPAGPNRTILILLGVIVLLLIAVIVYFMTAGNKAPATNTATNTNTNTNTGAPAAAAFDPATATKVADGQTPEDHVKKYFDAVIAGDYSTAFKMLPTSKQAEYGDEAAFTQQLQGYGVTGYNVDSGQQQGEEYQVLATATMPGGDFQYLWTFVKGDGGGWLVKARTLPGMAGQ